MNDALVWLTLSIAVLFTFLAALVTVKGLGLLQIRGLNLSRLRGLHTLRESAQNETERKALDLVIQRCESLRKKWILKESDLDLNKNTLSLVGEIAALYHPKSKNPVEEVRVGKLLRAFMEMKKRILILARMKGIRGLTQFRLRHLYFFSRAWKTKTEWQESPVGKTASRLKLYSIFKWGYLIFRSMDTVYWSFKMLAYLIYDVVFKVLLVQWYLVAGELALQVYRDDEKDPEISAEDILEDLEELPEQQNFEAQDLPEAIQKIAAAYRKNIFLNPKAMDQQKIKEIYSLLVSDIAGYHHPQSPQPLQEAKLYDLMMGVARFADVLCALESKPVLNKLLGIRISHIFMVKDVADFIIDHPVMAKLQKYKVGTVIKYSALIYKVFKRKHPGILFKDFAFSLSLEGGKRWFYIYLHDKLVVEANMIYSEPVEPTELLLRSRR